MAGPADAARVIAEKVALRATARAARAAAWADPAARAHAARRLAEVGAGALDLTLFRVVSGYLAMGEELDSAPLLAAFLANGIDLAMPVVVGKGQPLAFRRWRPGDPTVPAGFATREPSPAEPLLVPDLLLVPLLAFDDRGWRLGYGGGFYDRTLRALRATKPVRAIGVAWPDAQVDAVPHLDYDEKLDGVLTPAGPILLRA